MVAYQKAGIKKPATGFQGGLTSCDAEHMPVICPTCQILFRRTIFADNAGRRAPLHEVEGHQQGTRGKVPHWWLGGIP
jgi:hypothetical protein